MTRCTFVLPMLSVLCASIVAIGCKEEKAQAGHVSQQMPPPEVGIVEIRPEEVVISTELAGRIAASLVAEVRPQVTGILQKRLFEEGADVKEGEVLYQIDPALYEAALASARATLARTEANLVSLRNLAARHQELVAIHAISQQEYDNTEAALKQAEADLAANQAALETAQINLNYTQIKAPISGRIGKSAVTVGSLVTANQATPLAVIQQIDPVYADAPQASIKALQLKEDLASGRLAQNGDAPKARLILENGSKYPEEGILEFSDVTVDPSTGSLNLRTRFPNPNTMLLPGMYVRVIIEEGVNKEAILLPQRGVTFNTKGQPVSLVVGGSNIVESRILDIERSLGNSWLIRSGLQAGDRVILEGIQRARPGSPVNPLPFNDEAVSSEKTASTTANAL